MSGRLLALTLAVVAACGDNRAPVEITPDASLMFTPECVDIPQTQADQFPTAESLGPVVPGSLADWNPDGRWFLTGVRVGGVSSYHFERRGELQVVVDRDEGNLGSLTADRLFHKSYFETPERAYTIIKRVSNLAPDGTLRAERVLCDGENCRMCTARLERAERHAGEGEGDKLALVGEIGSEWPDYVALNVRVVGTLAYVVRRDGLYIVETADPAHPTLVGHWERPVATGSANDIKLVQAGEKRYAIIADVPVDIVDVTNPALPAFAAQLPVEAHTLAVEKRDDKTYAYFGSYDGSCPVWDVTNPLQPAELGRYQTEGRYVHDLSVEDGIAYLNAWDAGFVVVDFKTPSAPQLLGNWTPTTAGTSHSSYPTTAGGRRVAVHGDENYGAHLDVVDIDPSSPQFMKPIGSYKTRDHVSIHNVMAFGSKAYVAYYQDGVRVFDLSDPTQPTLLGYYNTWDPQHPRSGSGFFEGATGIDVDHERKLVFIADIPRNLLILSDQTPPRP